MSSNTLSPMNVRQELHRVRQELLCDATAPGEKEEISAAVDRLLALVEGRGTGAGREGQDSGLSTVEGGSVERAENDHVALEAQLRYQELFDFAIDAYLVTDWCGIIVEANHAAVVRLGTRKEFLIGKPLPLLASEECRGRLYDLLTRLQKGRTVGRWHARLQLRRGPSVDAYLCSVTANGDSQSTRLRWLLGDATIRSSAERALRAERDFAEGLLHATQVIVLVLDERGAVVRASPYLVRLCGSSEEALDGLVWERLLPEEERPAARKMIQEAFLLGASGGYRGSLQTAEGRRHISWTARALATSGFFDGGEFASDPESTRVLVVGHDVTDLQEAQEQVLRAERLATIGQVMASLAHESRNMLQRSQACLERLSWRLQDRPDALELVTRARQTQYDLAHLLEDVRAYAAPLHLDLAPCNIRDAWREAWDQVVAVFPEKPASLREHIDQPDLWCMADRFRLLQVFRNLLENSFAACARNVIVEIECRADEMDDRRMLRIVFRDNGPGFAAENRRRLFEPFWTTRPHGSGLGLVICRRIVTAHGGTITIGEQDQPGAQIILSLPREPV